MSDENQDDLDVTAGKLHVSVGPKTLATIAALVSALVSGGVSYLDTGKLSDLESKVTQLERICNEHFRHGTIAAE